MKTENEYSDDTLYELLEDIRKRPGLFLGTSDIQLLRAYIGGFFQALDAVGIHQSKRNQTTLFPLDFWFMHEFAKIKAGKSSSIAGWNHLILEECNDDRDAALERFFEYLDEFRALKAVSMKKAVLTEENILANDNMLYASKDGILTFISSDSGNLGNDNITKKGKPIYDSPQAVYIIELSGGNGFLFAVETARDIHITHHIFRENEINDPEEDFHSPARVFGRINTYTEIGCDENPDFGKTVIYD